MAKENNQENKSLPLFDVPFSRRVEEGWKNFWKEAGELRRLIDRRADGEEIGEQLEILLCPVLRKCMRRWVSMRGNMT